MHDEDTRDLQRFAGDGDEHAFAALVQRHLGLVYSAALRQVNGDAHLAHDVAQSVFTDLARKAQALAPRAATLAGWLYTSTHHAAAKAVRTEQRRRRREQEAQAMDELHSDPAHDAAWAQLRPHLDALMQRLDRSDREALVQRFFTGRSFAELGAALGVSENGARMRVDRALQKLRHQLERRGIHSTVGALGAVLATEAVAAAPAGLAAGVTSAALANAAAAGLAGAGIGILGMTHVQSTILALATAAGAAVVGVHVHEQRRLQAELQAGPAIAPETPAGAPTPIVGDASRTARLDQLRVEREALQERLARLAQPRDPGEARRKTVDPASWPPPGRLAATAFAGETVDMGQVDVLPEPVRQLPPAYPWDLRGIPGEATVSFVITADGEIADVQPEDATHPAFAIAAMDAVARWGFKAAQKNGAAVNVRVVQPMRFVWAEEDWF